MRFEQEPLFLDADDEVEPLGKLMHDDRIERPHHADLKQPQADLRRFRLIYTKLLERLAHVEIALTGRDDSDLGIRPAAEHHLVEAIHLRESNRRLALVNMQAALLIEPVVTGSDIEPALGHLEIGGNDRRHPPDPSFDPGRRLDRVVDAFDADPAARVTRQRETIER